MKSTPCLEKCKYLIRNINDLIEQHEKLVHKNADERRSSSNILAAAKESVKELELEMIKEASA